MAPRERPLRARITRPPPPKTAGGGWVAESWCLDERHRTASARAPSPRPPPPLRGGGGEFDPAPEASKRVPERYDIHRTAPEAAPPHPASPPPNCRGRGEFDPARRGFLPFSLPHAVCGGGPGRGAAHHPAQPCPKHSGSCPTS